jgi:hypothetical protein
MSLRIFRSVQLSRGAPVVDRTAKSGKHTGKAEAPHRNIQARLMRHCPSRTKRRPSSIGLLALAGASAYNTANLSTVSGSMKNTTDWHENAFDLMRGVAAYTGSGLLKGISKVIADHPDADIGNAFNHKQVGSKIWARQGLYDTLGGRFQRIVVLGGWYGILAAMVFDDERFDVAAIDSYDIDPSVGAVAETLNRAWAGRFRAVTADMYELPYADLGADLVINTSCEHIADLGAWLSLLPKGMRVLLQSNDYFSEPTHINCVASLDAFKVQAGLSDVMYEGALAMKKYTRFMLIGTV